MKYLSVFMGTLMCLSITACDNTEGSFPEVANPPPFDYVDGEELRSGMHQLAFALQRLDGSLATEYDETSSLKETIIDSLSKIERIGQNLKSGDLSSKHPFLIEGMESFLSDVSRAKWYAEKNRYYMAGRVAGACVSCHEANAY